MFFCIFRSVLVLNLFNAQESWSNLFFSIDPDLSSSTSGANLDLSGVGAVCWYLLSSPLGRVADDRSSVMFRYPGLAPQKLTWTSPRRSRLCWDSSAFRWSTLWLSILFLIANCAKTITWATYQLPLDTFTGSMVPLIITVAPAALFCVLSTWKWKLSKLWRWSHYTVNLISIISRIVEIDVPTEVHMHVTETLSSLLRQPGLQVVDTLVVVIHLISDCRLCRSNHMSHTSTALVHRHWKHSASDHNCCVCCILVSQTLGDECFQISERGSLH